jgi:hypothetical protein
MMYPVDRVQQDAEHCAYIGIVRRAGPDGDRPSTHAEIASDLKTRFPHRPYRDGPNQKRRIMEETLHDATALLRRGINGSA